MSNLTFDDIIKFRNSKEFIELDKYYKDIRTLDLFNYYGKENPHTNFLANLFKIDNPYTNNDKVFKLFLGLLSIKAEKLGIQNHEIFREICLNVREINDLEVSSQQILKEKKIPDITIQFDVDNQKYIILLEAKINAEENEYNHNGKPFKQTLLYRTLAEEKYNEEYNKYYVYLSNKKDPNISDKGNWIEINYQELVEYVLAPCAIETSNVDVPLTLDEYIKSYSNSYGKENIGNLRLAITPKEEELVESIWAKYPDIIKLIRKIVVSINNKSTTEYTEEEKLVDTFYENNKTILSFIYETLYKLEYINEGELNSLKNKKALHYFNDKLYNNVDLFYAVIKDIVEKEKIKNIKQLEELINIDGEILLIDDLEKIPSKYKDNYRKQKDNQNPIIINGKECYYITWFPKETIEKFIANVIKKYKRYEDILK